MRNRQLSKNDELHWVSFFVTFTYLQKEMYVNQLHDKFNFKDETNKSKKEL
jgi:hypothetical protein